MTGFDLSTATNITIGGTQASAVYLGNNLIWPTNHDYSQDYFTIESLVNNNDIKFYTYSSSVNNTVYISTDDGTTWISKTSSTSGTLLGTLSANKKMLIKSTELRYGDQYLGRHHFSTSGKCNLYGNIMSLVWGDNFVGQTTFPTSAIGQVLSYQFAFLFQGTKVVDAYNLILPATSLTEGCYAFMFYNRSTLVTPPHTLPATSLSTSCYVNMFKNCSSLTVAPDLPATTLAQGCYESMFTECSKLNYIKMMAINITPTDCVNDMLTDVAPVGTFIKNVNATWTESDLVPSGWTVQTASS